MIGASIVVVALAFSVPALAQPPSAESEPRLQKRPSSESDVPMKPDALGEDTLRKPVKDNKEPDEPAPLPETKQENPEEIIDRLQKNLTASEERLKQKDLSDRTRQIQDDIIRDLDALINREQQGGGGGGSPKPQAGKNSGSGGAQTQRSKPETSKPAAGNGKPETASNDGGGGNPATEPGEAAPPTKKEKNTIADLFQDVWGHLPAAQRMEMDAYSRERFMAKYEDLLREYYRSIAERGRRRGGN